MKSPCDKRRPPSFLADDPRLREVVDLWFTVHTYSKYYSNFADFFSGNDGLTLIIWLFMDDGYSAQSLQSA